MRTFQTQHMPTHGPKWGGGVGGSSLGGGPKEPSAREQRVPHEARRPTASLEGC